MKVLQYGNPESSTVLIQPVDEHDLAFIENEISEIRNTVKNDFKIHAFKVESWNHDLSPWEAPAVFGRDGFGNGAKATLDEILKHCGDSSRTYLIGGYSLAGLFAIWAAYQTDVFKGVAAASPSVWFPRFTEYMRDHLIKANAVYLSLGDREDKTRNPVMASVGARIREACDILNTQNIPCTLEWNPGNHFKDADVRTARAFSWIMDQHI